VEPIPMSQHEVRAEDVRGKRDGRASGGQDIALCGRASTATGAP
jgi:hypothetical protein